jgi:hypothetical protein
MTDMMPTTSETVPVQWSQADEAFFLVVHDLFPPTFLAGAGVLLASYDDDTAGDSTPQTCGQPHPLAAQPAGTMAAEVSRLS